MNEELKILVVDDEEMILTVFREYLEATNYSVITASNGFEALEIFKSQEIDCCFTDISMPGLDGLELTRKIHIHDNTVPVIIMTGNPSMDNAIETLKNGVVDFLTKPIKMEQLHHIIKRVMMERSLFIDNILLKEEAQKNRKLSGINQELQQKINEVECMNLILQQLDRAKTSKDLFNTLVDLSGKVTSCDEAHFCIFTQEMTNPETITSFVRNKDRAIGAAGFIEKDIIKRVADDGLPFLIKKRHGNGNIMAVPLKIRSNVFGVLFLLIREDRECFSEKDLYFSSFLAQQASFLIENLALYENIYENLFSTLYAFVETIEARDPYTKQHSTRVSSYAVSVARAMGCSQEEVDELNVSGNLHDIGKIGIPDDILLKPGRLTDEEYEVIKRHPVIGSNIIGHFSMWSFEEKIIRCHHERWDGKGYPGNLRGAEIPLLARILSVSDAYDALTTDRSYRKKMPENVALKIISENAGSQFDPEIVDVFLRLQGQGKIIANHEVFFQE